MKRPQFEKVTAYCRNRLKRFPDRKLPPILAIAKNCGVSPKTAHDALTQLKNEGVLTARWGYGYFPKNYSLLPYQKTLSQGKSKLESILNHLRSDIQKGTYPRGEYLPFLKTLQNTYQASYPTLKKALTILAGKKELAKTGSRYQVPGMVSVKPWRLKLLIITALDNRGELNIQSEQEINFFRVVLTEATRRKLDCILAGFSHSGLYPKLMAQKSRQLLKISDPATYAGFIVLTRHMKNYRQCLRFLAPIKLPVAVWFDTGSHPDSFSPYKNMRYFKIGYSKKDGSKMARHFMELGHDRIAYLSPFHHSSWSRIRLKGIREEYRRAGRPVNVKAFTLNDYSNDWSFMDLVKDPPPENPDGGFFKRDLQAETLPQVSEVVVQWKKVHRDNLIIKKSIPILEQAIKDPSITAWICANDLCALLYCNFLSNRNISVPGNLSVAGYDNTFEALKRGLTSFDLNSGGLATSMIEYILNPLAEPHRKRVVQPEGEVISRFSTILNR